MNFIAALYVLGVLTPDAHRHVHRHIDAIDTILAEPIVWMDPHCADVHHGRYLRMLRNATNALTYCRQRQLPVGPH